LCSKVRNSWTDETQADLLPYPKRMETFQKHSSFCLLVSPDTLHTIVFFYTMLTNKFMDNKKEKKKRFTPSTHPITIVFTMSMYFCQPSKQIMYGSSCAMMGNNFSKKKFCSLSLFAFTATKICEGGFFDSIVSQ
jgi:hypothetical protein